ncbi:MAG TPA: translation initiation factor IF-6 [Candidatus Nanoarchaeia archaeon]|nr:translation initiation factor IF-6 [Candidatus Nanoarchaeia archaeon]
MKNVMFGGFHGNPNIGLYGFATDAYCLLGREVPSHIAEQIGKTLEVPVLQMSIAGTSMIGVFVAGNSKGIIVPEIAYESELKILHQHKIKYTVINSELTALGNNIVVNDKIGFVNPEYSKKSIEVMEKALGVKLIPTKIAGMPTVGVMTAINNDGGLVHSEATEADLKILKPLVEGDLMTGSVNFGNSFVKSGIIVNNKGLVIGAKSTGVEVADAEQAFGIVRY